MSRVESSVRDYVSEHPDADYSAITARFGTPQQIASSYVDEMDTPDLVQCLRVRGKVMGIVSVISTIIVVLWLGVVVISYVDHAKNANGYAMVDIIEETCTPIEQGGTE